MCTSIYIPDHSCCDSSHARAAISHACAGHVSSKIHPGPNSEINQTSFRTLFKMNAIKTHAHLASGESTKPQ